MVGPPHPQLVQLLPARPVPGLHTGKRITISLATGYDHLLSQLCHREICTGSVERPNCLPHVCCWIIKLCRGQSQTSLILASGHIDSLLTFKDTNVASVAPTLLYHTRFRHPGNVV